MPIYYDVDLRRAKLREFAFSTPWYMMPLVALLKWGGFRFSGTTDDPPVETLAPFEVAEADLPADIRARYAPLADELAKLGFREPLFHSIPYTLHATRSYWASFLHAGGRAWARIHCRIWSGAGSDRTLLFPMVFTEFDDGSFLITSANKADVLMPEGCRMVNQVGADCEALWARHEQERGNEFRLESRRIVSHADLRGAMERLHARMRDYMLGRGIFVPLTGAEQQRLQGQAGLPQTQPSALAASETTQAHAAPAGQHAEPRADQPAQGDAVVPAAATVDPQEAAVLLELDRLQKKQSSFTSGMLVLLVSLMLFMGAGRMGQGEELLWTMIPVLLFHELGHYLAMRWFGYRNLRMFFIPFLGAAVAGQHYNVPGWKKAVVALLGPVPGIVVGGILGVIGVFYEQPWAVHVALVMLILNGFNLLPLLPLDGGWVMHAVLFARHPVLDVVFRGLAILALGALAWVMDDKVFFILPGLMLLALPMSWRIARVAHRLRAQGLDTFSPDAQTIPVEAARTILAALRTVPSKANTPQILAPQVAQVFETLNARPPGVLASLALVAVQLGSLLAAFVLAVLFVMGGNWRLLGQPDLADFEPRPPAHAFAPGQTALWLGPKTPRALTDARVTLVATCADPGAAKQAFDRLIGEVPAEAILRWFGHDVLLVLPAPQKEQTEHWLGRLRELDPEAGVLGVDLGGEVRVAVPLPPGGGGAELEAELRDHVEVATAGALIPPWSPEWEELPAEERARYVKARRTLRRLQNIPADAARNITVPPPPRMFGVDREALQEHARAQLAALKAEELRLLEQIRADQDDLDAAILAVWDQHQKLNLPLGADLAAAPADLPGIQEKLKAQFHERRLLWDMMARRMGSLSMEGDQPRPGSDLTSVRFATIESAQGTLHLYLQFRHPHQGLPALANWLHQRGCGSLRYEFPRVMRPDEDDEKD